MITSRLLSIILILKNKGKVTAEELANHFEVSVRTIYRDIDKISASGVPVAGDGGRGGGYYLIGDFNLDNMFLEKDQLIKVRDMMKSLDILFGKNKEFNEIINRFDNAIDKSKINTNETLYINMSHFSMEDDLKEYLAMISQSIDEGRLLTIVYINRNILREERSIEPYFIDFSEGDWYLNGYCRLRNGFRRFKLVRIKSMEKGELFQRNNQITNQEIKDIIDSSYDNISYKLRFDKKIGPQLSEYFSKDVIEELDDCYIVHDLCPYEEGLLKFILGFGDSCSVIEPEYLVQDMREYVKKILKKYK